MFSNFTTLNLKMNLHDDYGKGIPLLSSQLPMSLIENENVKLINHVIFSSVENPLSSGSKNENEEDPQSSTFITQQEPNVSLPSIAT